MGGSLEDLRRKLGKEPPAPVYLVLGAGLWARRQAVDLLRRAVAGEDPSPWAVSRGRAGECDIGSLLDGARTFPMGCDRRFVAITAVENLKLSDLEPLADYAEAPGVTSCLVLEGGKMLAASRTTKTAETEIFASDDGGQTWTPFLTPLNDADGIARTNLDQTTAKVVVASVGA